MKLEQIANNQVVITRCTGGEYAYHYEFFSYNSLIAIYKAPHCHDDKSELMLSSLYNYSKTTSKYLKIFLNDYCNFYYKDTKELTKLIDKGGCDDVIIKVID
jgi:hypothetical protein